MICWRTVAAPRSLRDSSLLPLLIQAWIETMGRVRFSRRTSVLLLESVRTRVGAARAGTAKTKSAANRNGIDRNGGRMSSWVLLEVRRPETGVTLHQTAVDRDKHEPRRETPPGLAGCFGSARQASIFTTLAACFPL